MNPTQFTGPYPGNLYHKINYINNLPEIIGESLPTLSPSLSCSKNIFKIHAVFPQSYFETVQSIIKGNNNKHKLSQFISHLPDEYIQGFHKYQLNTP